MRRSIKIMAVMLAVGIAVGGGIWLRYHDHRGLRANASEFESDMTEGLVRCLLREYGVRTAPACFLAFGEGLTPPSWNFLRRFSDCRRPAVRSLGSSVAPPALGRHFEISTGQPGLVIQIIRFKEYLPGTFDVIVAISNLPSGHDRVTYRISKTSGEWKLISRKST